MTTINLRRLLILTIAGLAAMPALASAATSSASISVSAIVTSQCTVAGASGSRLTKAEDLVRVSCSRPTDYSVALNRGQAVPAIAVEQNASVPLVTVIY